jgi:hypothetical protein
MVKQMANKYEATILKLNKFAWIVALVVGILWLIAGIVASSIAGAACAYLGSGYYYNICMAEVSSGVAWWYVAAVLAIVAGILAKLKVVKEIDAKNFDGIAIMLLVCAIIGLIADGLAGLMFLAQFIMIKIGGK